MVTGWGRGKISSSPSQPRTCGGCRTISSFPPGSPTG
ncbi:MAG TPA: hypothetical protein DEP84_20140 [Chloroflexi bacterium]|nr:hypothetical protein [Chloroflexota bacterium]